MLIGPHRPIHKNCDSPCSTLDSHNLVSQSYLNNERSAIWQTKQFMAESQCPPFLLSTISSKTMIGWFVPVKIWRVQGSVTRYILQFGHWAVKARPDSPLWAATIAFSRWRPSLCAVTSIIDYRLLYCQVVQYLLWDEPAEWEITKLR